MVEYDTWVSVVHEAYQNQGGTYDEATAAEIVQLAAEFWQRNKDELKQIARREALRIAEDAISV